MAKRSIRLKKRADGSYTLWRVLKTLFTRECRRTAANPQTQQWLLQLLSVAGLIFLGTFIIVSNPPVLKLWPRADESILFRIVVSAFTATVLVTCAVIIRIIGEIRAFARNHHVQKRAHNPWPPLQWDPATTLEIDLSQCTYVPDPLRADDSMFRPRGRTNPPKTYVSYRDVHALRRPPVERDGTIPEYN